MQGRFFVALLVWAVGCSEPTVAASPTPPPPATAMPDEPAQHSAPAKPAPGLPAHGIEVGKPLPAFVLPRVDGEASSIASLRGKKTVLHIFASW